MEFCSEPELMADLYCNYGAVAAEGGGVSGGPLSFSRGSLGGEAARLADTITA
jgi:hypothetical protein